MIKRINTVTEEADLEEYLLKWKNDKITINELKKMIARQKKDALLSLLAVYLRTANRLVVAKKKVSPDVFKTIVEADIIAFKGAQE